MASHKVVFAGVFASLMLAAPLASATSLIQLSTEDLALLSDAVVVARVEDVGSKRAGTGMIFTHTTLDIEEVWKGRLKAPSYLEVTTLGGQVGETRATVDGVPVFLRGERVLLYLTQDKKARWRVLGMVQGKLTVQTDATGKDIAVRAWLPLDYSGRDVLDTRAQELLKKAKKQDLVDLRSELESALAAHAAAGGGNPKDLPRFKGLFK